MCGTIIPANSTGPQYAVTGAARITAPASADSRARSTDRPRVPAYRSPSRSALSGFTIRSAPTSPTITSGSSTGKWSQYTPAKLPSFHEAKTRPWVSVVKWRTTLTIP